MVGGIYTADPEKLSLRATFPRFLDMETRHRSIILALIKASAGSGTSGARYSLFLSFDRGMQVLVEALEKRFVDSQLPVADLQTSCVVRTNTIVDSLTLDRSANGLSWKLKAGKEEIVANAVCLALPMHASAKLLTDVAPGLARELDAISYASTATINLAYRREDIPHRLDGFGFVVPFIEKRSLLACSFSSVKFSGRAPNDCVLLRAFLGGALQPEMFSLQDSEMVARVQSDLHDLIGVEKAPMFAEVTRWTRSMPQYEVGHLGRVERIENELQKWPGLRVAGNAFSGAGIPDCIRSGETVANELIESLIIDSAPNLDTHAV
jgi:oxygen-dependent protoporphyrinogen oxidase